MTGNRISLVTLGVEDLDRSRGFYEAWGWQVEETLPDTVFFAMGPAKFGLYRRAALAEELQGDAATLGTGASTLARNEPSEAAVDASYATALAAGATKVVAPRKVFWGGYSGTFADPDGHIWEVAHNPFWKLDAEGLLTETPERIPEMQLTAEDEAEIASLLPAAFEEDFGGKSHYLQRPNLRIVHREEGRIVAHIAVFFRDVLLGGNRHPVAGLGDVAVHPDHRGRNHAATLIAAAIEDARASAARFFLLRGVRSLYSGLGFVAQPNPVTFSGLTDTGVGAPVTEPMADLMVLTLSQTPWDPQAPLDLLGPTF